MHVVSEYHVLHIIHISLTYITPLGESCNSKISVEHSDNTNHVLGGHSTIAMSDDHRVLIARHAIGRMMKVFSPAAMFRFDRLIFVGSPSSHSSASFCLHGARIGC